MTRPLLRFRSLPGSISRKMGCNSLRYHGIWHTYYSGVVHTFRRQSSSLRSLIDTSGSERVAGGVFWLVALLGFSSIPAMIIHSSMNSKGQKLLKFPNDRMDQYGDKELTYDEREAVYSRYGIKAADIASLTLPISEIVLKASENGIQWLPLSSSENFRLLTIYPGAGDRIHCSLKEYTIQDPPSYDAISYCWTTAEGSNTIICDGIEVSVSQSLYDALKGVRRLGESRVWIDGLCISQNNVEERSQQVQNIGRIFQGASMVCIFLGEECDRTYAALDIVERSVNFSVPLSNASKELEVVLNLLERPWFERLWVIQEVCNARQAVVMLGTSIVPWDYIVSLCRDYEALYAESAIPSFKVVENITKVCCLENIRSEFHDPDQGHFLFDLVAKTSKFKVSDPRDKIFALVGLAKDVTDADWEVRPDYASSVGDVYHRFALWNLAKRGDFRLLSYNQDPDVPAGFLLPSWVPDFSQSDQFRTPELLAIGDEPPNPRKLIISSTQGANFLDGNTDEVSYSPGYSTRKASYTFQSPDHQWKCADGLLRPTRPDPKTWYLNRFRSTNTFNRQRVAFSGDNKIVHFVGMEVDELDLLSHPAFPESTNEVARLFLLQSKRKRWDPADAWRFCQFIEETKLNGSGWIKQCLSIARDASAKLEDRNADSALTVADVAVTLCCGRLISGLPDPSLTITHLSKYLNLDTLNLPLSAVNAGIRHAERPRLYKLGERELPFVSLKLRESVHDPATREKKRDIISTIYRRGFAITAVGNHKRGVVESLNPEESGWKRVFPAVVRWSKARRFGSTKEGRLASVPIGAQPGDKVCIILGGSVPYILRRRDDGYYTLIGECYIHGLMHGEAGTPGQGPPAGSDVSRYKTKQFAVK